MASSFTWLDYSETDRRKMLDVIDAFRDKETRDELGLGSVRDAFADQLFPGTSTIQTRARYFLFIPWIYQRLEQERTRSADIARLARRDEVRLIEALLRGGEQGLGAGVIGAQARARLQRLPSSVYWLGLGAWGIRRFPGSVDQYHRSLDRFYEAQRQRRRARGEEDDHLDEPAATNWHANLPAPPVELLERASFQLTQPEADYLSERVRICTRGSLLAVLLELNSAPADIAFPWELPEAGQLPAALQEQLVHARNFSEATHGAPLLYNLLLAELRNSDVWVTQYRDALAGWAAMLSARRDELARWDLARFWQLATANGAHISPTTRQFVASWVQAVIQPGAAAAVAENEPLRQLVRRREVALKGRLSRLENSRARDLWNGQSGTGRIVYRWGQASRLLGDIHDGLSGGAHA
jgi:hypothetical protein